MPLSTMLPRPASRRGLLCAVAIVGILAFIRAVLNGYAVDDTAILANPVLQSLRGLPAALASPWWYRTASLYRPLTLFTLGVDHVAGRGAAWLPHTVNVVLHAMVAVQVTRLYARFLPIQAAAAGGLLFAVLPAHVEAVASIVGRAELLAALALVTLLLLVTDEQPPTPRTRILVALLAAAALASKEGGVAAPVLALAAAWTIPAQRRRALQWAAAALAGTTVVLMARLIVLGTLAGDWPHMAFRSVPTMTRLRIALEMLPRAAEMLMLPVRPAIDYAPTLESIQHPDMRLVAVGLVFVAATVVALVRHVRRPDPVTLGMVMTAATLAPTANIFFASGVVLAGRTLYAPSVGALLIVGGLVAWLFRVRARPLVPFAVAAAAACSFVVTWREVPDWRSTESALRAMAEHQPDNYRVPMFRAYAARHDGRQEDALAYFRVAMACFPSDWEMATDAAAVALSVHDTAQAVAWLQAALDAHPRAVRARTRLFGVLRAQGDVLGAERLLRDGLRAEPTQRRWQSILVDASH